ncbi:hypothetical protein PQX77_001641 [Marasmius sp. AFHP31]|nr:hypothetical protein PQX77_001641 [Marasmius sp. AFHP31]
MVFANLPHHEKDAFFSLLDEYFQSRPELVAHLQGGSSGSPSGGVNVSSAQVKQAAGRVSAAASAFANQLSNTPPPRHEPVAHTPPTPARGLQSSQGIGSIDTSSKAKMVTSSLFGKKQPQSNSPPPAPRALGQPKNTFAPPPSRIHDSPSPMQQEEAPNGEWAEALYDYDSADPGDLQVRANQRVLVTERTTDDWWTGTFDGKSGLFPASYVKIL